MEILDKAHSGLRWIVLALLLIAIVNAILNRGKNKYEKKDKQINLFAMISLHVQLLLGFILYPMSGKVNFSDGWMGVDMFRFFTLEHTVGMLLAIILITVGRKKAEKTSVPSKKHGKIILWYTVGLIIILASIPWPFRESLGVTSWF